MKSKFKRTTAIWLCAITLMGVLAGCQDSSTESEQSSANTSTSTNSEASQTQASPSKLKTLDDVDMDVEATRKNYEKLAEELQSMYLEDTDNTEVALAYAEKLMQLGDVTEANEVLAPMLSEKTPEAQAIYLSAQIEYISGNYEQSESLYDTLLNDYTGYKEEAESGLELLYYQTDQYQKAQNLSQEYTEMGTLMNAYGSTEPYKTTWDSEEETTIPFIYTEQLPVVELEVNGEKKNFIIDTGAYETYLDETVADAMGIEAITTAEGEYAGGISVQTQLGILDSLKLGGVTLESIPVVITDTSSFSDLYDDCEISGVIGTGVFKQFYVTMNYISGELVLKSKGDNTQVESESVVSEMSFTMAGTHFMMCETTVNGKRMNMFLDSGLADGTYNASILLPKASMDYAGITIPETSVQDDEVGGLGGSEFEWGNFTADSVKMGDLPTVNDMIGLYGVFPESVYFSEDKGVFVDGIISHNYLKNYIWNIDYETMTMTFSN